MIPRMAARRIAGSSSESSSFPATSADRIGEVANLVTLCVSVTMPAFRDALEGRRCLVPASGYEWKRNDVRKTPYVIMQSDAPLFALAGLWEDWRDRTAGTGAEWIRTCTVVTCPSNELIEPITTECR